MSSPASENVQFEKYRDGGEDRRVSSLRMSDLESPELPIEISETDWEGDGEQNMG